MTISTETARVLYSGDDSTTTFPITFTRQVDGDVRVVLRNSSGTDTLQVDATDYNIVADDVEMVVAPATGEKLLLMRGTALLQSTAYPTDGPFPSASHETALDKLTIIEQKLQEQLDRTVKFKETSTNANKELPDPSDGEILVWNASGNLINATLSELADGTVVLSGEWVPELFDSTLATDPSPPTYVTQEGWFQKIGDIVTVSARITVSDLGGLTGGDQAFVGNLPFMNNNTSARASASIGLANGLAITAETVVTGRVTSNFIELRVWDATTGTSILTITQFSATGDIEITATYRAV